MVYAFSSFKLPDLTVSAPKNAKEKGHAILVDPNRWRGLFNERYFPSQGPTTCSERSKGDVDNPINRDGKLGHIDLEAIIAARGGRLSAGEVITTSKVVQDENTSRRASHFHLSSDPRPVHLLPARQGQLETNHLSPSSNRSNLDSEYRPRQPPRVVVGLPIKSPMKKPRILPKSLKPVEHPTDASLTTQDELSDSEDANCLVYRSADDFLPAMVPTPPLEQNESFSEAESDDSPSSPISVSSNLGSPILEAFSTFGDYFSFSPTSMRRSCPDDHAKRSPSKTQPLPWPSCWLEGVAESVARLPADLASSLRARYEDGEGSTA
ncbi:hypothetical protein NLJ89_g4135 [Agrocybe chaxingu]|uniref:Uncharacterized protein n=1 Tax=Agrocybe chaxingu TaxID=84603 RepID=A0A9W8MXY1_9AGAR|nr:hypothetical protein NLJ89_g4135 [Agrocybe chaxingu]